ncbi:isoprenoid synthase domain-containing protein [Lasiosphaeria hispida]|uniref:Isoprenoid synthase domain-containing protein n=1 Tax=Lasiosphaeria hispida TaxID=260671 RepID=A0AAJ0MA37_9PEZI|nr:isoprenoid synthase domain-containing protein [Lasiosphaeria hispida]
MEFRYSSVLDPSIYDTATQGLLDGVQIRVHKGRVLDDLGIIRAQKDWREHVSPLNGYRGCLHPGHSYVTILVPECLPDRLEIMGYATEFAFLQDDVFENEDRGADALNDMLEGFQHVSIDGPARQDKQSASRKLQSKMILEMLSIDRERALTAIKSWSKFLEAGGGGGCAAAFTNMDDYVEFRIQDIGSVVLGGFLKFSLAITMSEEEDRACADLLRSAWIVCGLANDLFSWEVEHRDAIRCGRSFVSNALWVMMQENEIDLATAKKACRQVIRANFEQYQDAVKAAKGHHTYSEAVIRYLDGWLHVIAGTIVWSATCPRYNTGVKHTAQQVEWMMNGIPKHLRDDIRKISTETY